MRYTFNMLTMLKEKVNTHFSFPLRLNMAGYVEKQLMPQHYQGTVRFKSPSLALSFRLILSEDKEKEGDPENEQYEYDLIGVTVHTGTADGGHYYSFIKDRTAGARDKWFLFNDAEVKPFDPNQIAAECFGGEMTVRTSVTLRCPCVLFTPRVLEQDVRQCYGQVHGFQFRKDEQCLHVVLRALSATAELQRQRRMPVHDAGQSG